jgi:hypothetical protein
MVQSAIQNANYGLPRGGTYIAGGSSRRDIDDECGFPRRGQITLEDYIYLFERSSIAIRVVEVEPRESWKLPPKVFEDKGGATETVFEKDWRNLAKSLRGKSWYEAEPDEQGNPIWQMLRLADELSGVGYFGALLIGLEGQPNLHEPAQGFTENAVMPSQKKASKIAYLRAYDQSNIQIADYEKDKSNVRFGQPTSYNITISGGSGIGGGVGVTPDQETQEVHWSRVIHLADVHHQATSSEVIAVPRMRPVYNEIVSTRKISGASGEFYYNHGSRDLIIESHPQLGGRVRFPGNMKDQVEQFQTGLQRSLRLAGASAKTLNPAVSDPSPHVIIQVKLICIKKGIPERIFWGSERGQLASSQDEVAWADRMMGRQGGYITPRIIIPFIDRCVLLGALSEPKQYGVEWQSLRELSPQEKAAKASTRAEAMTKYVGGGLQSLMHPLDFLVREMDYTKDEATEILELADGQEDEFEAQGMEGEEGGEGEGEGTEGVDIGGLVPPDTGEEDPAVIEERSKLLGMVGGITGMLDILRSLDSNEISHETATKMVSLFYQIGQAEASAIIGKERPPKPEEGQAPQKGDEDEELEEEEPEEEEEE